MACLVVVYSVRGAVRLPNVTASVTSKKVLLVGPPELHRFQPFCGTGDGVVVKRLGALAVIKEKE